MNQCLPASDLQLEAYNDLAYEPLLLHRPDLQRSLGRVALCWMPHRERRFRQEFVEVAHLAERLRTLHPEPGTNYFLSQNTLHPQNTGRRLRDVHLLNALWIDIDMLHPPERYDLSEMPLGDVASKRFAVEPEPHADHLLQHVLELGLPLPTETIFTGRGLCLKWLLDTPVAARAAGKDGPLRRWSAVEKHLVDRLAVTNWGTATHPRRWPVDIKARDANRVLRLIGTFNPDAEVRCRILRTGARVDFDHMAELVLPFTREELAARRKAAAQAKLRGQEFDANRARAAAAGIRVKGRATVKRKVEWDDADVAALWQRRAKFSVAVLKARGGARAGERNDLFWPMALSAAWISTSHDEWLGRVERLFKELFAVDGWTQAEANDSASAVLRRLTDPAAGGLYKMTQPEFLERFQITADELRLHGSLLRARSPRRDGAMGLAPLQGPMPYPVWLAKVRERQRLGGLYASGLRQEKRGVDPRQGAERRMRALQLASDGERPYLIARELGVSARTVSRWIAEAEERLSHFAALVNEDVAQHARENREEHARRERAAHIIQRLRREAAGGEQQE